MKQQRSTHKCIRTGLPVIGLILFMGTAAFIGFSLVKVKPNYVGYCKIDSLKYYQNKLGNYENAICSSLNKTHNTSVLSFKIKSPGYYFEFPWTDSDTLMRMAYVGERNYTVDVWKSGSSNSTLCTVNANVVDTCQYILWLNKYNNYRMFEFGILTYLSKILSKKM